MSWLRHSTSAVFCLGVFLAIPALADDVNLKEDARELGITVGQNYACTPDDNRAMARAESESIYDVILFGIDHEHAYIYAVAVGYGAAMKKDDIDCENLDARLAVVRSRMQLEGAER